VGSSPSQVLRPGSDLGRRQHGQFQASPPTGSSGDPTTKLVGVRTVERRATVAGMSLFRSSANGVLFPCRFPRWRAGPGSFGLCVANTEERSTGSNACGGTVGNLDDLVAPQRSARLAVLAGARGRGLSRISQLVAMLASHGWLEPTAPYSRWILSGVALRWLRHVTDWIFGGSGPTRLSQSRAATRP